VPTWPREAQHRSVVLGPQDADDIPVTKWYGLTLKQRHESPAAMAEQSPFGVQAAHSCAHAPHLHPQSQGAWRDSADPGRVFWKTKGERNEQKEAQKVPSVEVPWQHGEGGCSPDSPLLTRAAVSETNESPLKPWQQLFKLKLQPSCAVSGKSGADVCLSGVPAGLPAGCLHPGHCSWGAARVVAPTLEYQETCPTSPATSGQGQAQLLGFF